MKIEKLLIANRGEIAVRVIRTARDLGIKTVAVYADEDRDSQFVKLADEAYSLDGSGFASTYLSQDKILEVAKKSGANALHPGYGFLSENAEFANRCEQSNVKWLGPSGEAIDRLGDKVKARKVAEAAKVSPVPGISESLTSPDMITSFISQHDFPAILKRADGGGGHGITIVRNQGELDNFLTAHSHDLEFYFIERFVENARHVETQCARDSFGNFTVVSTRDCSIQRRNQKLIEEAPAPFLTDEIINTLFNNSRSLFETVEYVGLGTCEFLLETRNDGTQSVYFLEVNPRLQVEHTISEEVSGLDLVEEQVKIAQGEKLTLIGNLPLTQAGEGQEKGIGKKTPREGKTSFELRITSENPYLGMQPTAGVISSLNWPMGPGIRLEPGISLGDTVTTDFDSMVAKVIVTGSSRANALARCKRALKELEIQGISTPKELFERVLSEADFAATEKQNYLISTKWLENKILPDFQKEDENSEDNSQNAQNALPDSTQGELKEFAVEIDGKRCTLKLPEELLGSFSSNSKTAAPRMSLGGSMLRRNAGTSSNSQTVSSDPSKVISPMQGVVVRVAVEVGQKVEEGDLVAILEAMKMEKFITASASGTISQIHVSDKDSVNSGQLLLELDLG